MATIEFTGNYDDLSTDMGFQFKFFCERCGSGYMSTYRTNKLGAAGGFLRGASNFVGSALGRGADSAFDVQSAIGGKQHDTALRDATAEIRPLFKQCHACGNWMCESVCWNGSANMCKECAPVAAELEATARAQFVQQQVQADLDLEEEQRTAAKSAEVTAKCKSCGTATLGKRFCPGCGKPAAVAVAAFCAACGARSAPGAKFCADCGAALKA